MKTKTLGGTGIEIPEIGIGTYLYNGSSDLIREGIDRGANLVDTAEHYENEELIGQAIRGIRDRVFVATKVKHWRHGEVLACADASLRRLQIETIDLYQIHWPNAAIPIEETMAAMEELVERGKIRFIGVSNFTLPELQRAQKALQKFPISSNQVRYGLIDRTIETQLLSYCRANQITVIAFSSLGHDFASLLKHDPQRVLNKVAAETGKTIAQVALNWCVAHAGVITIPKTESATHMAENCQSSDWRLSPEQMASLDRCVRHRSRSRLEQASRRFARGMLQRIHQRGIDKASGHRPRK